MCSLLIALIIFIITTIHNIHQQRVGTCRRWLRKLSPYAQHSENIHPSDTEREFLDNMIFLKSIFYLFLNSGFGKNKELAEIVQQKLDIYKVQNPS